MYKYGHYIFLLLVIGFTILAYYNYSSQEKEILTKEPEVVKEVSILDLAKVEADSVFYYVNESVNLMTKKKLNANSRRVKSIMDKAKPFQNRLDSLTQKMTLVQKVEIQQYRQSLLDKVRSNQLN